MHSGTDAMGRPIPENRKQAAYNLCRKDFGLDAGAAFELTGSMADKLSRDKPYEAMAAAQAHLDLTGVYRLMATLLTEPAA